MTYTLVIRPEAEQDIREAFDWYEDQAAGLGEEFIFDVRSSVEKITDQPLLYQVALGRTRRILLGRFPYSIFFTIVGDIVAVTACIHQRRSPHVWMSRK